MGTKTDAGIAQVLFCLQTLAAIHYNIQQSGGTMIVRVPRTLAKIISNPSPRSIYAL